MPPSSKNRRVAKAADLYEQFTGHEAEYVENVSHNPIDVGVKIGYVDGVLYETVRDGRTEKYVHKFKRRSRPLLVSDHDGSKVQIIGGDYRFTDRGIVDN